MNEVMYPSLWMMIEAVALITVILSIAGFAICLACIVWLCFEETRQPAHRQMKPTPEQPESDEYDLLEVLTAPDNDPTENLTGGVARPATAVTTDFYRGSQVVAATWLGTVASPVDTPSTRSGIE